MPAAIGQVERDDLLHSPQVTRKGLGAGVAARTIIRPPGMALRDGRDTIPRRFREYRGL